MTEQPDVSSAIHERNGLLLVGVRAQPSARKNAIIGIQDRQLKVAVTAPPDKGKANAAIAELLATTLHVAKTSVKLHSGPTQRTKQFSIAGISRECAITSLESVIAKR